MSYDIKTGVELPPVWGERKVITNSYPCILWNILLFGGLFTFFSLLLITLYQSNSSEFFPALSGGVILIPISLGCLSSAASDLVSKVKWDR
jgi:hypothetical protein